MNNLNMLNAIQSYRKENKLDDFKKLMKTVSGDHFLTDVIHRASGRGFDTVELTFSHAFLPEHSIRDYVQTSSIRNFDNSITRLRYVIKALCGDVAVQQIEELKNQLPEYLLKDVAQADGTTVKDLSLFVIDFAGLNHDKVAIKARREEILKSINGDEKNGFELQTMVQPTTDANGITTMNKMVEKSTVMIDGKETQRTDKVTFYAVKPKADIAKGICTQIATMLLAVKGVGKLNISVAKDPRQNNRQIVKTYEKASS